MGKCKNIEHTGMKPSNWEDWTIFPSLRASFSMLLLQLLQDDRPDFAYSTFHGFGGFAIAFLPLSLFHYLSGSVHKKLYTVCAHAFGRGPVFARGIFVESLNHQASLIRFCSLIYLLLPYFFYLSLITFYCTVNLFASLCSPPPCEILKMLAFS